MRKGASERVGQALLGEVTPLSLPVILSRLSLAWEASRTGSVEP